HDAPKPVSIPPDTHSAAASSGLLRAQTRNYSTLTRSKDFFVLGGGRRRHYATVAGTKRVGLIGARGYTGQEFIKLIDNHPSLSLACVSSRELEGQPLKGYNKESITYVNLSPAQVQEKTERGDVDCWVLALPNGVCRPFVDAVDNAAKGKKT